MAKKLSFDQWVKKVDAILLATVGVGLSDLPDVAYADWYEDGVSPTTAAKRAKKNAME
jgi:hypothetical protein